MTRRPRHPSWVDGDLSLNEAQWSELLKRTNAVAGRNVSFRVRLALVSVAMAGFIGGGFILMAWLLTKRIMNGWATVTFCLVVIALVAWGYMRLVWAWYAKPQRMALRDMGYDVCVNCGYWLRDLPPETAACPECGAARTEHPADSASARGRG